jgi:hypothetical protein
MTTDAPLTPPPRWLVWLTTISATLAVLSLLALLWSRWGLVAVMMTDFLQYCF